MSGKTLRAGVILLSLFAVPLAAQQPPQWVINQSPNRDLAAGESATFTMSGGTAPGGCTLRWSGPFNSEPVSAGSFTVNFPKGGAFTVGAGYSRQVRRDPNDPNSELIWEGCVDSMGRFHSALGGPRVYEPPSISKFEVSPTTVIVGQESAYFSVLTRCGSGPACTVRSVTNPNGGNEDACFACGGSPENGAKVDPGDGSCSLDPYCLDRFSAHTYQKLGTFTARALATNQAGSAGAQVVVEVKEDRPPSAGFSWRTKPGEPPEVVGNAIRFQSEGFSTGGVRQWAWDFGDGTGSSEENPTHIFGAADDYVVTLTVTNRLGQSTTRNQITIAGKPGGSPPASAGFVWSPPSPVTGQRVQFSDRSTGSISRWRWNFESVIGSTNIVGAPLSYEQHPSFTFDTAQRKNVELTVSNEFGRKAIILFVDVLRSDQPPLAGFSFTPFAVTVGVPVQFTDESFGATSWLWDFGEDGATSTAQNPVFTYRTEGQKGVTLRVSNAHGSNSTTKFFACHGGSAPRLEALFTWTPTIPRPNEEVRFFDLSTGQPEKWSWTISDGTTSNQQNWTHRFAAEGDYIIGLRVDKGSATHQLGQQIRVRVGDQPVARFTWLPVQPEVGQEVRFENQSQNATTFLWQFDDGASSTNRNPVHTYREARTFNVTLTARNDAGAEHSVNFAVVVGGGAQKPVALFDVSPNPAKVGQPVQFIDRSTGKPTHWSWTFGHSGATSNLQNPVHTFTAPATYTVILVAENSIGRSEERGIGVIVKTAAKPVARFRMSPANPKVGQTVTFTDDSDNEPTSWSWRFGDGGSASGRQVTHVFTRGGKYDVTLDVANDEGKASVAQELFVGEDLLVDFTMDPPVPLANKNITFADKTIGNPDTLEWIIDGLPRGTGSAITYKFIADGVHRVELRVKRGTETSFRQKEFEVLGPPVARIRYEGEVVVGRDITFHSATKETVTKFAWTISGKSAGTGRSASTTLRGAGKMKVTLTVENAAGRDSLTEEIEVRPRPLTERPNVTKVLSRYGPCYFDDANLIEEFEVGVAWRNFSPVRIDVAIDGAAGSPHTAAASGAKILFPTGELKDSLSRALSAHTVSFTAIGARQNGEVEASDPEEKQLFVFRLPEELKGNSRKTIAEPTRQSFVYGTAFPLKEIEFAPELPEEIPFLGGHKFGIEHTQYRNEAVFRTDCTAEESTELEGAFTAAGGRIGLKGYKKGGYAVSREKGIVVQQGSAIGYEALGEIEREQNLSTLLGPASRICKLKVIGSLCELAEVKGSIGISGGGEWGYTADPASPGGMKLSDNTGTIKLTGAVGAELNTAAFKVEVEASLSGGITIGAPSTERNLFRRADLVGEVSAKVETYVFATEYKVAASCSYVAPPPTDPRQGGFTCGSVASLGPVASDALPRLNVIATHHGAELPSVATDGAGVVQDVSPLADPATAFRDERIVTVYLTENASVSNPLHRTDVRYVRNDGQSWSQPKPVSSDSLGEFNPDVAFRDANRLVAVWERNRNGALTSDDVKSIDDLGKLTREMEIVAATYDLATDQWSAPEALTSNVVYDYGPRLAALADGRMIAAWVREDESGAQQIVSRVLSGTTWSAEAVVATGVKGVGQLSIAARGNEAQLVFHRDKDGSAATVNDLEISSARFRDASWDAYRDLTDDVVPDTLPQVVYTGDAARVIWSRNRDVVWRPIGSDVIETIRTGDSSLGVLDATATVSPAGLVTLVRSDVFSGSSAAIAQLWDPATKRWSSDVALRNFSGRGMTVAPSFYGDDTLLLVTFERSAAAPVRSDLVAAEKQLRVDFRAAGTSATPAQPQNGERVTLSASFENRGELAVRNVPVHLYAGRVTSGTPIATTTLAGSWIPGETRNAELTFDYAAAAAIVTIVVDPERASGDVSAADNSIRHAFANVLPEACFQASALSGTAPLEVRLDASCSRDFEGPIVAYDWNIASGAMVSAGATTRHLFTNAGSYPVTLLVTDEMGSVSSRTMTVEVNAPNRRSTEADHSLYLSVAGRSSGVAGSYFVSDLDVLNTDERDLEIDAVFLPAGRSDTYHQKLTVGGGALLRTRDILANLFSATNGTGSIRLDLSHPHAVAVARTYNDQSTGTAGFSNEMVRRTAALHDGDTGVILQHWLTGYRTNIGFTEIGGQSTEITATAFDERGASLGSQTFSIGPHQHQQFNGLPLFQNRGRIELAVRGGSVLAYASTVDGQTADPIYQAAQRVPSSQSTLLIPIVSRLSGLNNSTWRSDVRVFNPMNTTQAVTVELQTAAGTLTATLDLEPGHTASFDDVIARLYPQLSGNVGGAMVIRAAGPLLASSRTFNLTSKGTYGLYVPARDESELLTAGETAHLVQLQENEGYRCNFGMTALGGAGRVQLRAFDSAGNTLATKEYAVAAGQNMQVGRILADMGVPLPIDAAGLEVRVLEGRLFAYASINDNRTGDGTFVEASR